MANGRILLTTSAHPPENFAALLAAPGVGPRTLRAFGIPFPVDRETYDRTIAILGRAVEKASIGAHAALRTDGRRFS